MRILLSALVTLRWTASVFAAMSLHPAIPFSFIQETMLLPAPPRPTTHTFGRAAVTALAKLSASDRLWDAESLSMLLYRCDSSSTPFFDTSGSVHWLRSK